ncbi:YoaK family protein [Idiomarina xiamenensis]|uniref:Transmembrane protein n=1 Tax=Idiomarina xiamenensis 10-D-4 TaxID=740709 RepID=K2KES3_9GAMM|nr:YoaK family protein [Idiomarina xiamenensis]EKE85192.1 hypothetical protein A10D4_02570 [Idiomarina xiamenensis 10-D-4]
MINRLPAWVEYGAFLLALLAGTVNAVGLLGFQHQSVSHLSGTATLLGSELLSGSSASWHLVGVLVSFLLGACLSGMIIPQGRLRLGRHYEVLLLLEALLLGLACYLLQQGYIAGHYLASAACGLQNAFATTYSGAIVRTTHVTGIFTDLGIMLGAAIRGETFDKRKALLFVLIIFGFIGGGVLGASLFPLYGFQTLLFPAGLCVLLAILYHQVLIRQPR